MTAPIAVAASSEPLVRRRARVVVLRRPGQDVVVDHGLRQERGGRKGRDAPAGSARSPRGADRSGPKHELARGQAGDEHQRQDGEPPR